jgi:hypothetical protein
VSDQSRRMNRVVHLPLALIVLVMAAPTAHGGFLFWGDGAGVHRANAADGSDVRTFPFLAQNLLVRDGKLYSIFENQVSVSNLDGSSLRPAPNAPATVQDFLRNVARDPLGNVYTSSADQGHVLRNGDGDAIATTGHVFSPPMTLQYEPLQNKIYWMGGWNDLVSGLLERANPDGSNVETLIGPDLLRFEDYTAYYSLDVPGGWVYWGHLGSPLIRRAPLGIVTDGADITDFTVTNPIWAVAAEPTPEPAALSVLLPALALMRRRRLGTTRPTTVCLK